MSSKLLIIVLVLIITCQPIFSQPKLLVIKANSTKVDIKDGKTFKKGTWNIVPEAKPDIYTTSGNKVTFYTDIDSISFKVKPNNTYDFVILLNGKDSAYTQIKYEPSYLDKLKKAKKYNYNDNRVVPNFTYQPMNNSELVKIRQVLKLDSIAGEGNEVSKIINLMYWVHDIVRHDGSSNNPNLKNAIDLIGVCKKEDRGINCRMMATILNECYLAMGIKSRFVTCMPRETEFSDCHVINMVYSSDLQKWVWMDPTFCAYVMDEKGVLLGLSEVRERLINGKTLILNPDANWNKKSSQTKDYYLENYMAKNLYRMQCPLVSEYDTETYQKDKKITYVELLPLDGIEQNPQKKVSKNETDGREWTYYKINNPNIFWAKP